jgi:prepilin-type N-terminal cleavage/methylation domain-containing protein
VAGFTLLELVFVVVILGALAKFAMMKLLTPATLTLPAQAQSVADLIRRAQSLAMVRGQRTSVSVPLSGANGRVAVACVASAPCSTDTSLTVSQDAVVGSASTIYFNSLGQPVNSAGTALASDANFTLSYTTGGNTATYTVTVAALTGRVSVSP